MMGKRPHILVVGSFVMDLTVQTERFPNCGETTLGNDFHTSPGGKGFNQAVQAARMGARVDIVGCLGADAFGTEMLQAAKSEGIDVEHVRIIRDAPTAVGNIMLFPDADGGMQNRIIVVSGANMRLNTSDVAFLKGRIRNYDAVLLQLEIPMEVNEAVAAYAYEANVPVMLNPAPAAGLSDAILEHITFLIPNETEAAFLSGISMERTAHGIRREDVRTAAGILLDRGARHVLITLGNAGSSYFSKEKQIDCAAVQGVHAIDPTAAGDSYIGSFAVARAYGYSVPKAMEHANAVAAITVTRKGGQPSLPTAAEVGFEDVGRL